MLVANMYCTVLDAEHHASHLYAAFARSLSLIAQLGTTSAMIDEPIADLGHADTGGLEILLVS